MSHTRTRPSRRAAAGVLGGLLLLSACSDPGPEVVEAQPPTSPTAQAPVESTEAENTDTETTEAETTEPESPTTADEPATTSAQQTTSSTPQEQLFEPADSDLISTMALCGDDTYDTVADVCPETTSDFTTSALHCTADAEIEQAGTMQVRFYRDGSLAYEISADIPEGAVGNQAPLYADMNVGELDLPQGTWGCEMGLSDGSKETAETTIQGPNERFSQGRACDNSQIFEEGPVTHCLQDEATLAPDTPEIGCSGVVTDVLGAEIQIRAEWDTDSSSGDRVLGTLESPGGVLVIHGNMGPQALTGDPEFPAGDYRCTVLVDGEEVGGHDFRVG